MKSAYEYDGVLVIVKDVNTPHDDGIIPIAYFSIDRETKIIDLQVYGFLKDSAMDEDTRMKYVPSFVKYVKSQREKRATDGTCADLTLV